MSTRKRDEVQNCAFIPACSLDICRVYTGCLGSPGVGEPGWQTFAASPQCPLLDINTDVGSVVGLVELRDSPCIVEDRAKPVGGSNSEQAWDRERLTRRKYGVAVEREC